MLESSNKKLGREKVTICISTICDQEKKLILASDSMLTNEGLSIEFEQPTRKMTELSQSCIALTSGDALAYTELFNSVRLKIDKLKKPSIDEIVEVVKDCYQEIRAREITERILIPRGIYGFKKFIEAQQLMLPEITMKLQQQIDKYDYGLSILLSGFSNGGAHIYGVFDPGTSASFDALGFHAIGSGLPHAVNALIARGCFSTTPWEDALMIVYEAKKMAEKAPGVGSRFTNICIMTQNQNFYFDAELLRELGEIYKVWIEKRPEAKEQIKKLIPKEKLE